MWWMRKLISQSGKLLLPSIPWDQQTWQEFLKPCMCTEGPRVSKSRYIHALSTPQNSLSGEATVGTAVPVCRADHCKRPEPGICAQ